MPCVFTGAAGSLAGRERRGGGAGKRGRQEGRLILPSKKKESGGFSRSRLFGGAGFLRFVHVTTTDVGREYAFEKQKRKRPRVSGLGGCCRRNCASQRSLARGG